MDSGYNDNHWSGGPVSDIGPACFEEVHGRADFQFPQLEMHRTDLQNLPELELPRGYNLRHYKPGDEDMWGNIMSEAFSPYWSAERFTKTMLAHFGFKPERVIFVCRGNEPVGSASAFQWPGVSRTCGYIHMVGVKRSIAALVSGTG